MNSCSAPINPTHRQYGGSDARFSTRQSPVSNSAARSGYELHTAAEFSRPRAIEFRKNPQRESLSATNEEGQVAAAQGADFVMYRSSPCASRTRVRCHDIRDALDQAVAEKLSPASISTIPSRRRDSLVSRRSASTTNGVPARGLDANAADVADANGKLDLSERTFRTIGWAAMFPWVTSVGLPRSLSTRCWPMPSSQARR